MVNELVGSVDGGLTMLFRVTVNVDCDGAVEEMQELN